MFLATWSGDYPLISYYSESEKALCEITALIRAEEEPFDLYLIEEVEINSIPSDAVRV